MENDFSQISTFQKLANQENASHIGGLLGRRDFFISPKDQDVLSRQHSCFVDQIFGFKIKQNEERMMARAKALLPMGDYKVWGPKIHNGVQTWVGLDVSTLQTPYHELTKILMKLKLKNEVLIDLGAAYGRLGLMIETFSQGARFIGFEASPERVRMSQDIYYRLRLKRSTIWAVDIFSTEFIMPAADVYFIYDYGFHSHIAKTLSQLSDIATQRPMRIVARGIATQKMIEHDHPWLVPIYRGKKEEKFNIYQSH